MAKGFLDELLDRVQGKPAPTRKKITREVHKATEQMRWVPTVGPQTNAYLSDADILLYGGQAGGGKSSLTIGWGINEAHTGIIFRRELTQTDGLEADGKAVLGTEGWNGTDHEWTRPDGRTLKLAGMRTPDSWNDHAGRERDYQAYDEAGEFLEIQVGSLFAWLRGAPGQRTRIILASNPPRSADGFWLFEWFGPWLDEKHPLYPTPAGELRWGVYVARNLKTEPGKMTWVDGPGEYKFEGETYTAMSYTFIPASLEDNPYRNTPEYRARLQRLPEPLRSQLLKGDWQAGLVDDAYQVIPSTWVRAAQQRWEKVGGKPPEGIPMCALGIDPTGGGEDDMVMAPRYDAFFATLIKIPAKEVPQDRLGSHAAGLVVKERRNNALPVIDMGGGYGGALLNHLTENNEIECMRYKGAASSTKRTATREYGFTNTRSAAYWKMREDLDPDQPGGSRVALPPDKRLLAGLCAPRYTIRGQEIQIEPKSKHEGGVQGVVERLGWSPNEADAVVMANWGGPRWSTHASEWIDQQQAVRKSTGLRGMQPKVVMGHQAVRRRR